MGVSSGPLHGEGTRKRKVHTKSRQGCNNCKLRRVKCDEGRPSCQKCISYCVACDFGSQSSTSGMQLMKFGDEVIHMPNNSGQQSSQGVIGLHESPTVNILPESPIFSRMHPVDLSLLQKFQSRTIMSIGTTGSMPVYKQNMLRLASTKPFLLHLVLTLTLMHDRYLYGGLSSDYATAEAFHWYRGTVLFNDLLTRPVKDADKDALWASAALLGAIAFASTRARTAEEAWPLAPPSVEDLEWLKMTDGKKAVFKIANPHRPESVFKPLTSELDKDKSFITVGEIDLDVLPAGFVEVYELDDPFTKVDSPYYGPILVLSRLMTIEVGHATILKFLTFPSNVNPEYKRLLEIKEPRAMVILAWWFAIVMPYKQWWVQNRVRLECQSICLYLERFHPQEIDLHKLLKHPREACGLG